MKTLLGALLLFVYSVGYSQSNCKPYVPVTKGTTWEITSYSPKDKVTGTVSYELLDVVITDNESVFSIRATTHDKKGEQTYVNEYNAKCVDGKFEFDMSFMIDGEAMEAYKDMDVDVDASEFEVPSMDAEAGTILKDGNLTVKVGSSGMTIFKMVVKIEATSKEWYAENVGIVRSESYNKKGKLTGYDVLTKLVVK